MEDDKIILKNRGVGMLISSIGNRGMNEDKEVNTQKPTKREYQDDGASGSKCVSSWASVKQYNNDHDSQWFEDENAEIAELYGGDFIYAKYLDSQPGKVGYYCELCYAEMNARKSLELHCLGMRHLKKKVIWEKMKVHDEDGVKPERGPSQPPRKVARPGPPSHPPHHQPSSHGWYKRGPSPVDPGPLRRQSPYQKPPPPEFRNNSDRYERDRHDRYPDNYYNDNRKEPMPYRPPYAKVSEFSYERRSPPGPRNLRHSPGPYRSPYKPREAPPPPVISAPERSTLLDAPPTLFAGIDHSCHEILKRLASCRVKNSEDAILATNVATFLLSSLTEYYSLNGPSNVVQVPTENPSRVSKGVDGVATVADGVATVAVPAMDWDIPHFAHKGTTANSEGGTRIASTINGEGTPHPSTHGWLVSCLATAARQRHLYGRGVGYTSVNTARGALSSLGIIVDGCRVVNHPLVNRFLRGVFNLRHHHQGMRKLGMSTRWSSILVPWKLCAPSP